MRRESVVRVVAGTIILACVGGLFLAINKTSQNPTREQYKKLIAAARHLVNTSEQAEREEPYLADLEASLKRIRRMREQMEPQREACERYFKEAQEDSEDQRDLEQMRSRLERFFAVAAFVEAVEDPNCASGLKPAWIVLYRAMYGSDSFEREYLLKTIEDYPELTAFEPNDPDDERLWQSIRRHESERITFFKRPEAQQWLDECNVPQWLTEYLGQCGFLHEWETGIGIAFSLWRPQSVVQARERMQEAIAQLDEISPQWRQMQAELGGENASQEVSILEKAYEKMSSFTKKEDILQVLLDQGERIEDFYVDFDVQERTEGQDGSIHWSMPAKVTFLAKDNMFRSRKRTFSNRKIASDWEHSSDGDRDYHCDRGASYGQMKDLLPQGGRMGVGWGATYYLTRVKRIPRGTGQMGFEGCLIGTLLRDPWITVSDDVYDGRPVVTIAGTHNGRIFVDPAMNYAIVGGDAVGTINRTYKYHHSDFVEVIDGIWMPRHVEFTSPDEEGRTVREVVKVNKIAFNSGYKKDDFRIKVERGMQMWDVNTGKTVRHPYDVTVSKLRTLYRKVLGGNRTKKTTKPKAQGNSEDKGK